MRKNLEKSPGNSSSAAIEKEKLLWQNRIMKMEMLGLNGDCRGYRIGMTAKRERSFKLSLPILVTGIDAAGKEIREFTELISISSQEAVFLMISKVMIGSRLILILDIPKTFLLENQLKLEASGSVTFIRAEQSKEKKQLISLKLDKNYKIRSIPPKLT